MGILADFIVASPEDALRYEMLAQHGQPIPPERFQRAEYKKFTPLALEMLWSILRNEAGDGEVHRLEHVSHASSGESWLFRFPDALVHLISALDETRAHHAAHRWARAEEVPGNADELRPVLRDLQRLAVEAKESNRGLYLWGSL